MALAVILHSELLEPGFFVILAVTQSNVTMIVSKDCVVNQPSLNQSCAQFELSEPLDRFWILCGHCEHGSGSCGLLSLSDRDFLQVESKNLGRSISRSGRLPRQLRVYNKIHAQSSSRLETSTRFFEPFGNVPSRSILKHHHWPLIVA